ncbi:Protein of unknown function [Gryllus bimaculatus]|nr:Protein of unknown function [Gryllus bimaculatus]
MGAGRGGVTRRGRVRRLARGLADTRRLDGGTLPVDSGNGERNEERQRNTSGARTCGRRWAGEGLRGGEATRQTARPAAGHSPLTARTHASETGAEAGSLQLWGDGDAIEKPGLRTLRKTGQEFSNGSSNSRYQRHRLV